MFRYHDHLVANRMAPSMCPDPCGTRWRYLRIFGVYAVRIFFKNATKLICLGDAHATTYILESVLVRIPLMHCASLLSVM